MNETEVTEYRMNPDEDEIRFGDELREGMWILPAPPGMRFHDGTEDGQVRAQRFRRIVRIRQSTATQDVSGFGVVPAQIVIVGEWIDKYQQVWTGAVTNTWLVKKSEPGTGETP